MAQDDLPPGPYEVFKCEDERWGWDVEDKDGQLIAQNCTEQLARAIAAIPEMRAEIGDLKAEIDWHCGELDRLRADRAELLIALESFSKIDDAEFDRNRELEEEIGRLRAEKSELQKQNDDLRGDYPRNIGVEITEAFADNQRLRKEITELIEMLATRTTHPEYVEVLRRYRYKNETEA